MSVKTFLQSAESIAKKAFSGVITAELWAAPIEEKVFPGYAGLIAFGVSELASLKTATAAASSGTMTDEQIAAAIIGTLEPAIQQWAGAAGVPAPTTDEVTAWINALIAGLNAFRAPASLSTGIAAVTAKTKPAQNTRPATPKSNNSTTETPDQSADTADTVTN